MDSSFESIAGARDWLRGEGKRCEQRERNASGEFAKGERHGRIVCSSTAAVPARSFATAQKPQAMLMSVLKASSRQGIPPDHSGGGEEPLDPHRSTVPAGSSSTPNSSCAATPWSRTERKAAKESG